MISTRAQPYSEAEATVLAVLRVCGASTDHHIAFLMPFLHEGAEWRIIPESELAEARASLTGRGLVVDTGERDWKQRTIWAAVEAA